LWFSSYNTCPFRCYLRSLLGEFHPQDQMLEAIAIHLLARFGSIGPLLKADERKALCQTRFSVLGEEDSSDTAEPLEHVSELLFFCHLRDLPSVSISRPRRACETYICNSESRLVVPFILATAHSVSPTCSSPISHVWRNIGAFS